MRFGWTEILVILGVVLIFFGGKRLPELGKAMGKALRGFKDGLKSSDELPTEASAGDSAASPNQSSSKQAAELPAGSMNSPESKQDEKLS